jgi:hypothetical protein
MHITGNETAILASGIAFGAASVSIWVAYRTARWNREQRLWQQRSDIYVDLLAWAIRIRELVKSPSPHKLLEDHHAEFPGTEELVVLEARGSAFASKNVENKVNEMSDNWNRLRVIMGDFVSLDLPDTNVIALRHVFSQGIGQPEERLESLSQEVSEWADGLIGIVSDELQSLKPLRH